MRAAPWRRLMTKDDSNRVFEHFAANSSDLTPAPAGNAARVFYVPVSHDPEVTKLCSSVLSDAELRRANRFVSQDDKVLFTQRRAFRRFCGALVLGSPQPLSQIDFNETDKGRPHLASLPDYWFSFSSCRFGFIGAWSSMHGIGVDFESQNAHVEAIELAQQFFSETEANAVKETRGPERLRTFFHFWCLKEAALKSIGEGLPFGLEAFEFGLEPGLRVIQAPLDYGGPEEFEAHLIEGTDRCAALVIRTLTPLQS